MRSCTKAHSHTDGDPQGEAGVSFDSDTHTAGDGSGITNSSHFDPSSTSLPCEVDSDGSDGGVTHDARGSGNAIPIRGHSGHGD